MRKSEVQKIILEELKKEFYPEGKRYIDWMGYPLTNKNKPTYHHIEKATELRHQDKYDEATKENGAILGKKSHGLLNQIEHLDPELYECWNYIFLVINNMGIYPIDDVWKMVYGLQERTKEIIYGK